MAPSTNASTNAVSQIWAKVQSEYNRTRSKKLLMVDGLIVYTLLTALVQVAYMVFVGSFPFNSFLSGLFCHIGLFSVAVSLRLQLCSPNEFADSSPEKSFGDFAVCALVLLFVVFSFLG